MGKEDLNRKYHLKKLGEKSSSLYNQGLCYNGIEKYLHDQNYWEDH